MNDVANPLVSVVIPTYNHARYLGFALQSVLNQTYTNWEAIVVDNHSTDNTDEVIKSFANPRITYLKIHNHGVIAASRNAGIRAAKGEWVAFLDSDDWWTNNKLQVSFERVDEKVDLVYHDMEIVGDQPRAFRRKTIKSWQVKPPVLIDLLLKGNAIVNSSVLVRKRLLKQIDGFNESRAMIASEDFNAWLRIAQLSNQFLWIPHRLGFYLKHDNNISKKDMSLPYRCSVDEFIGLLSGDQKLKLEANIRYTSGRSKYLAGHFNEAKEDLWFAFWHCKLLVKAKVIVMLLMMGMLN